jgi:hypothetical protein
MHLTQVVLRQLKPVGNRKQSYLYSAPKGRYSYAYSEGYRMLENENENEYEYENENENE